MISLAPLVAVRRGVGVIIFTKQGAYIPCRHVTRQSFQGSGSSFLLPPPLIDMLASGRSLADFLFHFPYMGALQRQHHFSTFCVLPCTGTVRVVGC